MNKYFLVTTALEETWQLKTNTLFLGEWCKLFTRRCLWQKIDTKTHPYHWDDRIKYYADYQYLAALYEEKLLFLSQKLGKMHGVTTNIRFWRIIIGPWLRFFIDAVFDRYEIIRTLKEFNKIENTFILQYQLSNWAADDFACFYKQLISDEWNHIIFSECIKEMNLPFTEIGVKLEKIKINQLNFKDKLVNKVLLLTNKLTPSFLNKVVIIAPYINVNKLIKWQLKLLQLPFLSKEQSSKLPRNVSSKMRFLLEDDNSLTTYEQLLNRLLVNLMPINYIENFAVFYKKSMTCYPRKPKVIYTANAYQANDSFKFWLAHHVTKKVPFVLGQHGGNMGIAQINQTEDHQINIADVYASWGWHDNHKINVQPLPTPQLDCDQPIYKIDGDIVMAVSDYPRYFYCQYSIPVASQVLEYINEQIEFIDGLNENFRKKLKIRLVSDNFGWDLKSRLADDGYGDLFDNSKERFISRLNGCRLSVSTSNTTTFLETLSLNFPTLVFFNPNRYEIREDATMLINQLKKVGILHDTPSSATALLNTIGEDITSWWSDKALQKARQEFCNIYALKDSNWNQQWQQLFELLKK